VSWYFLTNGNRCIPSHCRIVLINYLLPNYYSYIINNCV